jgi:hypothetical protein
VKTWEEFRAQITRAPRVVEVHSCDIDEDGAGIYIWLRLAGGELGLISLSMAELAQRMTVHDVGEEALPRQGST